MLHLVSDNAVRLTEVPEGTVVRLHDSLLDAALRSQLRALGLTDGSTMRICKRGDPCIVRVRMTRIGMARTIAAQLLVVPFEATAASAP
jgi:Fe2+ transport system protein FeoA